MDKFFWGTSAIVAILVIGEGIYQTTTPSANAAATSADSVVVCKVGTPSPGRFYPIIDNADFRTGPGTNYPKIVSAQATSGNGRTEYRAADTDEVLEGVCATADWLQAKIVEADGEPKDWETGWVPKRLVTKTMSADHAAGLWWDAKKMPDIWSEHPHVSSAEIKIMHEGALKVLKDNKNCESIAVGYPDDKKRHTYDVECNGNENTNGGFVVRFTENDLRTGKSFAPPEPFPSDMSNQLCREAILRAATHPSTVNFHILGVNEAVNSQTGERKILREFDAKNGFGLELNYAALCVVTPTGKLTLGVNETG